MQKPNEVEYKVVLVSPGFGEERANAEEVIEEALEYLNTHRETPGWRFAPNVSAGLEIVADVEEAEAKLRTENSLAMVILHDLPEEERIAFTYACAEQGVSVCHTTPPPEQPEFKPRPASSKKRGWKFAFRKRSAEDGPPAHTISETTLTAPLDGDPEEVMDRIGQLIAVLALGVMQHHWGKNPPRLNFNVP